MNLTDYLPDLSLQTVEILKKIITPSSLVFETGSGNSTIWFGKQVKKVVSLEDDKGWCDIVRGLAEQENLQNINLYFDPDYSKKHFNEILQSEDIIEYDIVLHDGPFNAKFRVPAMKFIHSFVKTGGYLIVDNINDKRCGAGIKEHLDILGWEKTVIPTGCTAFGHRTAAAIYRKK
ncbi:MAG: class I SAM-dependent methyltransferase [Desulfobacterales bacterium]|nr:class I SAM-dependent methyltransferase [Desulfobacterales bacterium]